MSAEKLRIVVNPISGTSSKRDIVAMAHSRFCAAGMETEVCYTTCRGDATRLAREAAEMGCAGVVAIGGDGTVNEIATALCSTSTALGIVPCGSGNGLARHLGLPMSSLKAVDTIIGRKVTQCDHCTINEIPFFCTFGLGFDAAVSHDFARMGQRGLLSYVRCALSQYRSYKPETYKIKVNGKTLIVKALVVAGGNASQYGNNAYIAPRASVTDGLLDITIILPGGFVSDLRLAMELFGGKIDCDDRVISIRAEEIEIEREAAGAAHVDGEPLELPARLLLKCHKGTLNVFTR